MFTTTEALAVVGGPVISGTLEVEPQVGGAMSAWVLEDASAGQ